MKTLMTPRPVLLWLGLFLNTLPFHLNLLGIMTVDQSSAWTDILWIPSVAMLLASCDFPLISLLLVVKAMDLSLGHNFYPFYIGFHVPLIDVLVLLVLAAITSIIGYIQRRALKRCIG